MFNINVTLVGLLYMTLGMQMQMKMPIKSLIITIIADILTTNAFGANFDYFSNLSDWPLVVSVSGGTGFTRAGATQTINLAPLTIKTFAAHKATNTVAAGSVFIGLQKKLMPQLLGQYGFVIAKTSDANLQGYIWDDANPIFDNAIYQYHIQSTRVAVQGKLLLDKVRWIEPWIGGSLGVSFNRAHGFNNIPTIAEALPMNNFDGHIENSFSYTLGAGFQTPINKNWQIGVGYEFADWGESQLNRANGQTENSGPTMNHLYSQAIMLNLTYVR
jgi:opacity protein-like surface antigen